MRLQILFFLLLSTSLFGGNLDRIRRTIAKQEYEKARELIQRAREKEPNNPGISYLSALLYSTDAYNRYNLDTARLFINRSVAEFQQAGSELIDELKSDSVTIEKIEKLGADIRDRIFEQTLASLSFSKADEFLKNYPGSPHTEVMTFKRDSIAFDQARSADDEASYEEFVSLYPGSSFSAQARDRLDELRYEVLKQSGDENDYYRFLEEFPETKFRMPVEAFILKKTTAGHDPKSYLDFMAFTSVPVLKKQAADLLYYLSLHDPSFSYGHPLPDSIRRVQELEGQQLFPAIEGGKFGFYQLDGRMAVGHRFEGISEGNKCAATTDEWLLLFNEKGGLIADKVGNVLIEGAEDYGDLGYGIASVKKNGDWFLYHKSGFPIAGPVSDAEVLNGQWIKIEKGSKWGLVSFTGYEITSVTFDNIGAKGNFWVFEKGGLLSVATNERIVESLGKPDRSMEFAFDDVEFIDDDLFIGFRDEQECMLNDQLDFLIPWGDHQINPDPSGWYIKSDEGYRLYDREEQELMDEMHPYLETNAGWLALKTTEDWMLLPRNKELQPSRGYDSLKLVNDHAVLTMQRSGKQLLFSSGVSVPLGIDYTVRSFTGHEAYAMVDDGSTKTIHDDRGDAVVRIKVDGITFFNDSLLRVETNKKQGLINLEGDYLVDPIYDILDAEGDLILCLTKGKIGSYDLTTNTWISSKYEARIERVGANYLVKQNGKYGVINAEQDLVLSYSYDEVLYWNDTSFLVNESGVWSLLNEQEEPVFEDIGSLTKLTGNDNGAIWRYVRDGKYGLLSTQDGVLLPPEYTDVFLIGTSEEPLFFADQHLPGAGFHVVSYIDQKGDLVVSNAYREEDFERLLCDE